MFMAAHNSDSGLNADAAGGLDDPFGDFDDGGDLSMDLDSFFEILGEPPVPLQSNSLFPPVGIANEGGSRIGFGDCDKSMLRNDESNITCGGEISSEPSKGVLEGMIKHPCYKEEISLAAANEVSRSGNSSESCTSHAPEHDYVASMLKNRREEWESDYFLGQTLPAGGKIITSSSHDSDNFQTLFSSMDCVGHSDFQLKSTDTCFPGAPKVEFPYQKAAFQDSGHNEYVNPFGISFLNGSGNSSFTGAVSEQFMFRTQDETSLEVPFPNAMNYQPFEGYRDDGVNREVPFAYAYGNSAEGNMGLYPGNQSLAFIKKEEEEVDVSNMPNPLDLKHISTNVGFVADRKHFPVMQPLDSHSTSSVKKELDVMSTPMDVKPASLTTLPLGSQVSSPKHRYDGDDDDDDDLCILEDMSQPPPMAASLSRQPFASMSHHRTSTTPQCEAGVGGPKVKSSDGRLIVRAALQDLSQPMIESNPPDGSLTVPLLRHQRIALSWMVQKETAGWPCAGGILADDQGLGKTVSTIALILTEKPSSRKIAVDKGYVKLETLDLDGDDNVVPKADILMKNCTELAKNGNQVKCEQVSALSKGRPAAGTLIVCPTSVIRQWAEELRTKVTSEANLSVLVYHGSHRTKDPHELARHDVVLTTYSIVGMEVPKQHLSKKDDDDDDKRTLGTEGSLHFSSSKKRKCPSSDEKRCLKRGLADALPEVTARPLARVRWFRVVLDEAQSIKNHKTRVAQACWGLRAKRRWCLSGTPMQNAVDDLYSYFRFLRYDPYAVYQSFCSILKAPISNSPTKGYRKLQAVLKTVMLRRTKGTLLDGKPIICLPPKSVELKKVEFSQDERDFYSKLEADSRAQFQVYAASGTVQQNYVNILLLLLRLRQACDHPLLVRGYDSSALRKSSLSEAKKLPLEKIHSLVNCLEASLAICGICNDPPEDAVVTTCGHVFCSQCICEHLSGDNNQCPAVNCKAQLCTSSVFSGSTLNSCLSNQTIGDNSAGSVSHHSSNFGQITEPCSPHRSIGSCKIRTAMGILLALSKPEDPPQSIQNIPNFSNGETPELGKRGDRSIAPVANEKAIVFSQWTRMLDLLEGCLKESPLHYRRLDGTMSVAARDKAVRDFNTLPEVTVMIMSLKAASLGLNMVAACRVLLLDPWWNPTTEDQAIDRAHRIGQTRPVTVFRLTVKDTVEDRILALQKKKREMVSSAFGEDETGSRQTRLTVEDLNYLFRV